MIVISLLQAVFFSLVIYLIAYLLHGTLPDVITYFKILGISFIASVTYELALDRVVSWFNRKDSVFRG